MTDTTTVAAAADHYLQCLDNLNIACEQEKREFVAEGGDPDDFEACGVGNLETALDEAQEILRYRLEHALPTISNQHWDKFMSWLRVSSIRYANPLENLLDIVQTRLQLEEDPPELRQLLQNLI